MAKDKVKTKVKDMDRYKEVKDPDRTRANRPLSPTKSLLFIRPQKDKDSRNKDNMHRRPLRLRTQTQLPKEGKL
jgi:hypothetical protein